MRCVITGATGLIGSHLVPRLSDWEVHATRQQPPAASSGVRWHDVDLAAPQLATLPAATDAVVYLAQSPHFREFPERADHVFGVNVAGVQRFLDYALAAKCRTFVLASTGGVYAGGDAIVSEASPVAARADMGFYAATKLAAETLAQQYAARMSVVILRFFFVYGPGQAEHMLVPRLVQSVRTGTPITLAGQDGIRISPTYVDDAAAAVARAVIPSEARNSQLVRTPRSLREPQIINVAGPETVSLRALATMIGDAVGRAPVFRVDAEAAPRDLVADTGRMRALLHAPVIGVREGVRRLVESMSDGAPGGR